MENNIKKLIDHCSVCHGFTCHQLEQLLQENQGFIKNYKKGSSIFTETERPTRFFILIDGKVNISRNTLNGKRILMTTIENVGDIFGEVYLFIHKEQYEMTAEAVEDSVVLELSNHIFTESFPNSPQLSETLRNNLLHIFANKAYLLSRKVQMLSTSNIREKIAWYLIEHQKKDGSLEGNFKREYMADYMNITRPSLSRELSNMQKEGILSLHGRNIIIENQEKLESYLL